MQQLSLIPEKLASPKQRKVPLDELPTDLIGAEPEQGFIESIKKFGILQPIGLMENGDGYQVAFGRRRIKAARALEILSISALIYPQGWTPISTLTLIENKQRSDNVAAALDAIAQLRLIATSEEICAATGITQQELSKAIKLIDGLTPELQSAVKEGRMTSSTAQKAIKLPSDQQQVLSQQETIKPKDITQLLKENVPGEPNPKTEAFILSPSEVESNQVETSQSSQSNTKIAEDSWRIQAKPLIMKLLEIVPEDEEVLQYIQLVANELKIKDQ